MKKILICAHNLSRFVDADRARLCLGPEHILTPGAKDAARNRGISIVYGVPGEADAGQGPACPAAGTAEKATDTDAENLGRKIMKLLSTEFSVTDPARVRDVTLAVMKRLETNE